MTVSFRFGDIDARRATFPARVASLETAHQAVVRGQKLQTAASNMAGAGTAGSSWS
jgi:hypothetical protein